MPSAFWLVFLDEKTSFFTVFGYIFDRRWERKLMVKRFVFEQAANLENHRFSYVKRWFSMIVDFIVPRDFECFALKNRQKNDGI